MMELALEKIRTVVFSRFLLVLFLLVAIPANASAQPAPQENLASGAVPGQELVEEADKGLIVLDSRADPMQDAFMHIDIQESLRRRMALVKPDVAPPELEKTSVFFSPWQHALLREAIRGMKSRPPTQEELPDDGSGWQPPQEQRQKGIRELSLGGIVYSSAQDWTIWLNGKRVTPDALPPEALDLEVHDDFIQMKWFDGYTNLVFPLRLRPHQRFNLDTRIFLPGAGVAENAATPGAF